MKSKRDNFEFILNKKLNHILNRDFSDAEKALKEGLFKSAVVLYGGIIEAVLLYFLLSKVNDKNFRKELKKIPMKDKNKKEIKSYYKKIKKLNFNQLIKYANQLNIILDPSVSNTIRDFRNFIHIFKELERLFVINKSNAKTAGDFTKNIIDDFNKDWKNKTKKGKLFFTDRRAKYFDIRSRSINNDLLRELCNKNYIDLDKFRSIYPGQNIGSALSNMSGWGICQIDSLLWDQMSGRFQKWIFNPYFKDYTRNYLRVDRAKKK
ncbi:MAG: hypothetical protein WC242_01635 [Candidatus Paceibacterota bacterium]|jgi:hypothetical protein